MTQGSRADDERVFRRVVDYVQGAIANGDLQPGDRLPSERDLSERFGIGRSSVREALRVLENMELVRSTPRDLRGPLILPASAEPIRRSMAMLASTSMLDLGELVVLRMIADSSANLLAATRRTDTHLLKIERSIARMRACIRLGYSQFSQADLDFHDAIAEACCSPVLQVYGGVTREAVLNLISRKITESSDQRALMLQSVRQHKAVFDALVDHDALLASRLAREALYAYYADHVGDQDRAIMAQLVLECGGTLPT